MSPVKALRSSWAATVALAMVMWAQLPHSAYVFQHIILSGQDGWPFALGFEAAVLMFVVRNMHAASWFFATLSALINVLYYEMHGAPMWHWLNSDNWGQWLLSLALPLVIAMYSHILAHVQEEDATQLQAQAWMHDAKTWMQSRLATWRQPPATVQPAALQSAIDVQDVAMELQRLAMESASDVQDDQSPATEDEQPDPKQRALQLRSEGFSNATIAGMLQVNPSTVGRWLKSANGMHKA